jgi:hypothetical protein
MTLMGADQTEFPGACIGDRIIEPSRPRRLFDRAAASFGPRERLRDKDGQELTSTALGRKRPARRVPWSRYGILSSKYAIGRHSNYGRVAGVSVSLAVAILMATGQSARAASLVQQEFARWKIQDKCISDSLAKFPDRDVKSQRSRDEFVDACLQKNDMPPRNHMAPTDDQDVPVLQSH